MLIRLLQMVLQVISVTLGEALYFLYAYSRLQNGLVLSVSLSAIIVGGLYWWTLQLVGPLLPWGERLLGAAAALCGVVVWGNVRRSLFSTRRRRRTLSTE